MYGRDVDVTGRCPHGLVRAGLHGSEIDTVGMLLQSTQGPTIRYLAVAITEGPGADRPIGESFRPVGRRHRVREVRIDTRHPTHAGEHRVIRRGDVDLVEPLAPEEPLQQEQGLPFVRHAHRRGEQRLRPARHGADRVGAVRCVEIRGLQRGGSGQDDVRVA